MTSQHDLGMTWEGERCGGFLTTQNQGKLGNLLKQKQNQTNQAKHIIFIKTQKINSLIQAS